MQGIGNLLRRVKRKLNAGPSVFPSIEPWASEYLKVDDRHEIYIEQCGNKSGIPVVFLHGGPGSGCNPYNRRFFNPQHYHIILFDQRGAGRSRPYACLENNTTADLLGDMETIRKHLGIDQWLLFGGSWGSTLALAYAQAFPGRTRGIIARGVFLCRQTDIDWFFKEGASRILPEQWKKFCAPIPTTGRKDLLSAYHQILTADEPISGNAAVAWCEWEGSASTLVPSPSQLSYYSDPKVAVSMAKIECHFFKNLGFLEENQLIRNAHRLKGIPGTIIHGRYDLICPVEGAVELHNAWPESHLQIVSDAGHSITEPGITRALIAATNRFAA